MTTAAHEVTMPKHMNMADLVTSLTKDATGYTKPKPERRQIGRSIARDVHEGFSHGPREQARAARTYAEAWYQAIRRWETNTYEVPMPAGSGRGGAVMLTSGTPGVLVYGYLRTPLGKSVTETAVGEIISAWEISALAAQRDMGDLLHRLRGERGRATLLDERGGWISPKRDAVAYAVAVLSLAVALGDGAAGIHLSLLRKSVD